MPTWNAESDAALFRAVLTWSSPLSHFSQEQRDGIIASMRQSGYPDCTWEAIRYVAYPVFILDMSKSQAASSPSYICFSRLHLSIPLVYFLLLVAALNLCHSSYTPITQSTMSASKHSLDDSNDYSNTVLVMYKHYSPIMADITYCKLYKANARGGCHITLGGLSYVCCLAQLDFAFQEPSWFISCCYLLSSTSRLSLKDLGT